MILCELPTKDVSTVRLVNKDFKTAVDDSHALSVRRFMKSGSASGCPKVYYWKTTTADTYASAHFTPPPERTPADPDESFRGITVCTVHPRLTACGANRAKTTMIKFPPLRKMMEWPAGGSWEQILLMQPPCKEIVLEIKNPETTRTPEVTVRHEQGVRFGHVVAKLREVVEARDMRRDALAGGYAVRRSAQDRVVYGWVDGFVWEGSEWVSEAKQNETRVEAERLLTVMTDVFEEDYQDMDLESATLPEWKHDQQSAT